MKPVAARRRTNRPRSERIICPLAVGSATTATVTTCTLARWLGARGDDTLRAACGMFGIAVMTTSLGRLVAAFRRCLTVGIIAGSHGGAPAGSVVVAEEGALTGRLIPIEAPVDERAHPGPKCLRTPGRAVPPADAERAGGEK